MRACAKNDDQAKLETQKILNKKLQESTDDSEKDNLSNKLKDIYNKLVDIESDKAESKCFFIY